MHPADLQPRFVGCLIGGAVGDALGAPVEFMSLADIQFRLGPDGVTGYTQVYGRMGAITDDTQMTMFTAEGIIRSVAARHRGLPSDPLASIHRAYLRWLHSQARTSAHPEFDDAIDGWLIRVPALHSQRAPGNTCLSALMLPHAGSIEQPLNDSKGCGGVMRVAPIGLWGEAPFELGCRAAALTHGHPSGYLAAGVMATLVAYLVGGVDVDAAVRHALAALRPRLNDEVVGALEGAIAAAQRGVVGSEVVESLGQGWVAEEALAIAVYCAMVARDFAHGVMLAVNHGGDSDSTGSLTGNLLGAAMGLAAIPARWIEPLELADEIAELGRDLRAVHFGEAPEPERYSPG